MTLAEDQAELGRVGRATGLLQWNLWWRCEEQTYERRAGVG